MAVLQVLVTVVATAAVAVEAAAIAACSLAFIAASQSSLGTPGPERAVPFSHNVQGDVLTVPCCFCQINNT